MPELPPQYDSPVVLFLHGIGDALLALPSLRALCTIFPERLTLVCESPIRDWFYGELPVARILTLDSVWLCCGTSARNDAIFDAERLATMIGPCDLLIPLMSWRSTCLLELMERLAPRRTVGVGQGLDIGFKRCVHMHAVDQLFRIPATFAPDLDPASFAAPPMLPKTATAAAQHIIAALPESAKLAVVHTQTGRDKQPDREEFVALVEQILRAHEGLWVLALDEVDQTYHAAAREQRFLHGCGMRLDVAMSITSQADLFVGVDSCMLHAADLFGRPSLGLFAATSPAEFGFRFTLRQHIVQGVRGRGWAPAAARAASDLLRWSAL